MKKKLLASSAALLFLASFLFQPVRNVAAAGVLNAFSSMAITNSTIDSTPIGQTTAAAGSFTSMTGASVTTNWAQVNGMPTPAGNNGFTGWGRNSTGDFDFFAANSGASPSFYWFYLLGSTNTVEMFLDTNANLHIPNGGVAAQSVQAVASATIGHYTVATLPSPVTLGTGGIVVVTDCTTTTVGALCTGGGSNVMLAISTGSVWTVH